ncbi:MAG: hypothetical protein RLZ60_1515 [Pseudomonadota bacterium]
MIFDGKKIGSLGEDFCIVGNICQAFFQGLGDLHGVIAHLMEVSDPGTHQGCFSGKTHRQIHAVELLDSKHLDFSKQRGSLGGAVGPIPDGIVEARIELDAEDQLSDISDVLIHAVWTSRLNGARERFCVALHPVFQNGVLQLI